jgi:SAM-dependent methyltransferase
VAYARAHRPVTIREQLLSDARYPDASFDLVTLWDVLEHVPEPLALSRDVARILRPGGIFALTTINHDCLNQRLLGDRWRYWMPPDHVCSFSPDVLRRIMSDAGLEVVAIEHHAMFEVLADVWLPWISRPSSSTIVLKVQKLAYLVLSSAYQAVLNAFGSGDLLTLYARKP